MQYEAQEKRKLKQKADKKERSKEVGQAAKQNRIVTGREASSAAKKGLGLKGK